MRRRLLLIALLATAAGVACTRKRSLYLDPGKSDPEATGKGR